MGLDFVFDADSSSDSVVDVELACGDVDGRRNCSDGAWSFGLRLLISLVDETASVAALFLVMSFFWHSDAEPATWWSNVSNVEAFSNFEEVLGLIRYFSSVGLATVVDFVATGEGGLPKVCLSSAPSASRDTNRVPPMTSMVFCSGISASSFATSCGDCGDCGADGVDDELLLS
jgi:hypothetical protein